MIYESNIVELICDQLKYCLVNIRNFTPENDNDYYLLGQVISHYGLLIKLFQSNITLEEYINKYKLLYSEIKSKDYNPLVFLNNNEKENKLIIEDDVKFFIKILDICYSNVLENYKIRRFDLIKIEADCNHNVPTLIASKNIDLIKFYIHVECECYKKYLPKDMLSNYELVWKEICNGLL